jgi:hypothetical protein
MALRITRGVSLLAFAEMLEAEAQEAGLNPYAVAQAQDRQGRSFGFVDETGRTLAIACFVPIGAREYEACFVARRALAPRLAEWVRLAQLSLPLIAEDASVMIRVRDAAGPGARLGKLLGFVQDERRPELWFWGRTWAEF